MEVGDGLKDDPHTGLAPGWREQFGNFFRNALSGEWFINLLHMVDELFFGKLFLGFGADVHFVDDVFLVRFPEQFDGGLKGNKVGNPGHVDAVTIGITDLRGRGCDDNFSRAKPVKYSKDALLQGSPPYN